MTETATDVGRTNSDELIGLINEAISDGDGALGPAQLVHRFERKGWKLLDDRDPAGTEPNNEVLIETIIDAWNDAMMDGMGRLSKYRFEYQLKRHDLFLVNAAPAAKGSASSRSTGEA